MNSPFIDPEILEKRLANPENVSIKHKISGQGNHHVDDIHGRRGNLPGTEHKISPKFKALIGALAKLDGNKSVAKEFNLYPSQVSNYRNAVKPDGHGNLIPDVNVQVELNNKTIEIESAVKDKVSKLIDAISEDEINSANLATKAKAASSLAGVIDKLGNKNDSGESKRQFVFIGVPTKDEKEYAVIDVEARVING